MLRTLFACLLLTLTACTDKTQEGRTFYGEVDATEIDVGVKLAGRLVSVAVKEGDTVKVGDVLATLQMREVDAKQQTARAGLVANQEQLKLAEATYLRIKELYEQNAASRQKFDEAKYNYEAARQKANAAQGQLKEVDVYVDESKVVAPLAGEVVQVVASTGELVSAGYPVVTVLDVNDQWVTFNVREDRLADVKKGQTVQVFFPALKKTLPHTVTYVSQLGNFARWRATNEQGQFDLKTFEVRARATEPIADLRPGMSAVVSL